VFCGIRSGSNTGFEGGGGGAGSASASAFGVLAGGEFGLSELELAAATAPSLDEVHPDTNRADKISSISELISFPIFIAPSINRTSISILGVGAPLVPSGESDLNQAKSIFKFERGCFQELLPGTQNGE
jgi:hypothetical protein